MATTYRKVACHCGLSSFKTAFATQSLPLAVDMCHCNMCRHSTGQTHVHDAPIQGEPLSVNEGTESKPADLQHLLSYRVSRCITRFSCRKCSAFVFDRTELDEGGFKWSVPAGVLDHIEATMKVAYHAFVGDTLDGGLADHYRKLDSVELARYMSDIGARKTLPQAWKGEQVIEIQKKSLQDNDTLSFYCHCRTINFHITPPPKEIASPDSEWWFVKSNDNEASPIRYSALHCVCNSCRLCSGSIIQSWVYVPLSNVIDKRTSKPVVIVPTAEDTRIAGLVQYESSPGTFREACGTCGANVFFWKTIRNPMVLDISAGLLDQDQEGARAERWFAWRKSVEAPEDAVDRIGLGALEDGLQDFKDIY